MITNDSALNDPIFDFTLKPLFDGSFKRFLMANLLRINTAPTAGGAIAISAP